MGSDSVKITAGNTVLTTTGGAVDLAFADSDEDRNEGTVDEPVDVSIFEDEIELIIEDVADPGDWIPEKLVLTLTKHPDLGADEGEGTVMEPYVRPFTAKFTVTITDDDPKPVLKFVPTDIQLAKGNQQTLAVEIGVGAGGAGPLPGAADDAEAVSISGKLAKRTGEDDRILLSVSPPDAVGPFLEGDRGIISITQVINSVRKDLEPDGQGRYDIGTISQAVPDDDNDNDILLTITAKAVSGFRDERITLMLTEGRTEASKIGDGGAIDDAAPATVTVLSGEETPTVTFSTDGIDIDEGDSETVHLLASGMQGDEVGSAAVRVRGEASISLEQDGNPVSGSVSFGGNANAELTIRANSDPSLEDGEEKTATVTITDANDADHRRPERR